MVENFILSSFVGVFVVLLKTWTICSEMLWNGVFTSAVWYLCIHNKWKVCLPCALWNTRRRRFDVVMPDCLHPVGMKWGTKVRSIFHLTCQTYRGPWSRQTLNKVCFPIYKDNNTHFHTRHANKQSCSVTEYL